MMQRIINPLTTLLVVFALTSCANLEDDRPRKIFQHRDKSTQNHVWLIKDVNVLSMSEGTENILRDRSVLIVNDQIALVAPTSEVKLTEEVFVVNGKGKYLLPGLIDTHVHIWDEAELPAYLAYGITTVRNASGMPFHLKFSDDIAAGRLEGPRLFTTGPILNGQGPNTQPNHQIVNNGNEARAAVQQQYDQGFRHLKVYSNLSRDAFDGILQESKRLGMTIMGHTPEGAREPGIPFDKPFRISFKEVLAHNFISIEHMESIVWHGLYDDLDQDKARGLAKTIAASGVAVDPTLIAHHNLVKVAETQGAYLRRPGVETLNPFITALEQESYDFWSTQARDSRRHFDKFYRDALKIFHEEGVMLVTGTDAGIFTNIPGESLIRELELFVRAGLTPYQAIEAATINAANMLGLNTQVGQIKVGYIADLILVDENPLENINTLLAPSGLVIKGQWKNGSDLNRFRLEALNTSYTRTERRVLDGLSAQGSSFIQ